MPAVSTPRAVHEGGYRQHLDEDPDAKDGLGLIGQSLLEETGAAGALIAADVGGDSPLLVTTGVRMAFLLNEDDGLLEYLLSTSALTTRRMPAPEGSGFEEVAFAAFRSPSGARGAICLATAGTPFEDRDSLAWTLDSYARLAGIFADHGPGFHRLAAAATRDGLTGCLNYATLRRTLEAEIERTARYRLALSVCFIDLDRFKAVNDDEGHGAGNTVLAEIGTILRREARASDSVARYGGDEFVVLLPETPLRAGENLAKRLRSAIATVSTPAGVPLSASAGVAQWRADLSAEQLLTEADENLRREKSDLRHQTSGNRL